MKIVLYFDCFMDEIEILSNKEKLIFKKCYTLFYTLCHDIGDFDEVNSRVRTSSLTISLCNMCL